MHVVEQDEGGGGDGADALGELACLDHDRDLFCGWGWVRSAQQRTLRQVTVPAGGASEGWSGAGRAVTPAAVCGVARCRGWLPGSPVMRCGGRTVARVGVGGAAGSPSVGPRGR